MYTRGKWLLFFRNKYGYNAVFQKKIYKSRCGPYDHHELYKIEALCGNHDITFDCQKVEIHLSDHKITPRLRFGINHPVCWTHKNDDLTMINKEESLHMNPHEWTDELCVLLFFLCIQELSTRTYHYKLYYKKTNKNNHGHFKAIVKTLFVLRYIVNEAKKRDIYY